MAASKTYAQTLADNRQRLARARVGDPGEHFPYKLDAVQAVLDEDPPMGPGIPGQLDGGDDRSFEIADYMTQGIAEASAAYVAAQEEYLLNPADDTRSAYEAARDRLVAARLDHRENRGESFVIGAAARRAG